MAKKIRAASFGCIFRNGLASPFFPAFDWHGKIDKKKKEKNVKGGENSLYVKA